MNVRSGPQGRRLYAGNVRVNTGTPDFTRSYLRGAFRFSGHRVPSYPPGPPSHRPRREKPSIPIIQKPIGRPCHAVGRETQGLLAGMDYLSTIDRFAILSRSKSENEWTENIKNICRELGYDDFIVSLTRKGAEGRIDVYIRRSSSPEWCSIYETKLELVDPSVTHCQQNTLPLIWRPEIFSRRS